MLASLNCPNCGAPLPLDTKSGVVVCLYCNSSIRVQIEGAETLVSLENRLDEHELSEVKRLLVEGKRAEALERYRASTDASEADTEQAVDGIARQLTYSTVRTQQLTPFGWLLVASWSALFIGSIVFGLAGSLKPVFALIIAAFSGFNLYFFIPSVRTSLQFAGAPIATAVTLKLAPIGVMSARGKQVHTFRVWLEVQPANAESFRAEMILPVREANLARAVPGAVIRVKYLRDPLRMIYHGKAE